jgi:predicted esterase
MGDFTMEKSSKVSQAAQLEPFVLHPTSTHTHTIILLHGLGSNGEAFGTEFQESGRSSTGAKLTELLPDARFIFPTAKRRRSSAFRRTTINQWFDIASLEDPFWRREVQLPGLAESAKYLLSILHQELETIPSKNIVLGGLSQGCAMALLVLLSLEFPLGGFVGMSGWLPFRNDLDDIIDPHGIRDHGDEDSFLFDEGDESKDLGPSTAAIHFTRDLLSIPTLSNQQPCLTTPVFLGHGKIDEKVKCQLGDEAVQTLSSLGMQVTWKSYPGLGHWYKIPEEIDDILEFLGAKLG